MSSESRIVEMIIPDYTRLIVQPEILIGLALEITSGGTCNNSHSIL